MKRKLLLPTVLVCMALMTGCGQNATETNTAEEAVTAESTAEETTEAAETTEIAETTENTETAETTADVADTEETTVISAVPDSELTLDPDPVAKTADSDIDKNTAVILWIRDVSDNAVSASVLQEPVFDKDSYQTGDEIQAEDGTSFLVHDASDCKNKFGVDLTDYLTGVSLNPDIVLERKADGLYCFLIQDDKVITAYPILGGSGAVLDWNDETDYAVSQDAKISVFDNDGDTVQGTLKKDMVVIAELDENTIVKAVQVDR